jgi:HEAT repeat protein
MDPGTNALWVVPLLLPYLQEAPVMACIANVLSLWRLAPGEVVPALTRCLRSPEALVRREAAEMLPRFGSEASSAVPELLMVLSDTDRVVRFTATNALRRIAPEELKKHE